MEIDHLVLMASHLAASVAHYDRLLPVLGFRKTRDHVWKNEQGVFVDLRQAKNPEHAYARHGAGLNHLGVRATSREHVDAIVRELRGVGIAAQDPFTIDEAYVVFVPDPDGLRVEVGYDPG